MYSAYSGNPSSNQHHPERAPQLKPNETEALSLLQHLDKDELNHLLQSESKLDDLVDDLQQVKQVKTDKELLIASNKSLAEYNMSKKPHFTDLKNRVCTVYEEVNQLKTVLAKDIAKLDGGGDSQSLDTLLAVLQTAAAEAEETSEVLADGLFNKKVEVDSFVQEYIQIRKLAHMRRVQAEKMSELIQSGLRNDGVPTSSYPWSTSQTNSPSHAPYHPSGSSASTFPAGSAGPPPYPMGSGFGMPEPLPFR